MALKRLSTCESFKRRKNLLEMLGNEQLIKRFHHLLSYSKRAKNFTLPKNIITDFSLARVLCDLDCMMNKSRTPYLHCMRLRRVTAPRPPELIRRAVASFWGGSYRHLVYFDIVKVISNKRYHHYNILSSIGTLNWVNAIMYSLETSLLSDVWWM